MAIEQQLGGNQALDNVEHARQALARSDLAQALFHVSSALATEPNNAAWRAIADQVLAKAPDAMVFVRPDEAKADFITAATRGYVLAHKQQWGDALATVCEVVAVRPDCAYLGWAREWVGRPGVVAQIDVAAIEKRIIPSLLGCVTSCPSPCPERDPRRANCEAAVDVLGALYAAHPQNAFVIFAMGVALRRVGRFDEAIQYAGYAFQLKADWNTCVGLAAAYRDAKKVDEAVQTWRHALQLRPDEASPLLDIGDTYAESGRHDAAIGAYQEMLARAPGDAWATASIVFSQWKQTNDPAHQRALYELSGTNSRARALLFEIVGDRPFFTWLPAAGDSTAFAVRDITQQLSRKPPPATGMGIDIPLTYLEAPSAFTAFQLWTKARGWMSVGIAPKVESVQQPDPRFPRGAVDFVLWAFDDKRARPGVQPPDPRVHAAIASIATTPYSLPFWETAAQQLGAQMGTGWLHQLLCAMVHPPALPSAGMEPLGWVQKCQVATALVIAHLEPGWEGTQKKKALMSLALGPSDWIVDAAIVAMGWLATKDGAIRKDVEAFFAQLERQIPQQGFTCWEYPLVNVWKNLGEHPPETQKKLELWKVRCESQKIEFAEEKHGGMTLAQYAEHRARNGMRMAAWDQKINADAALQKRFFALQQKATLASAGIDASSHEGRVAQQIQSGGYDVESQKQNAMAAAAAIAAGEGGDADPLVFPGKKLAKLSDYVGLTKAMQTGDFNGALKKYGIDMNGYMQASQAWGIKLASDPMLTAKYAKMMGMT